MTEFSRVTYNFNDRGPVLNDTTTNTNRFVLVGEMAKAETTTTTVEADRPSSEGIIDFGSKISGGELQIPLILYSTSIGHMNDLIDLLKQAWNPQLVNDDSSYGKGVLNFPGGDGFMPLQWTETLGTGTRAVEMFVKPLEVPVASLDSTAGRVRTSVLSLRVEDPRKYAQTQSTITNSDTATNSGNFRTPTEITITASGATSTSLTITNSTNGEAIVVSTAMADGEVLVIDTRHHSVQLDGVETRSMISTSSDWIHLDPGANTISVTNGTNASVVTAWNSAWAI